MGKYQDSETDKTWPIVLEKIKDRYNEYCIKDGKTYPPIPFNSTPEPYQHLVESFKEELSALLGKSGSDISKMIPSPSLFAEIFRTNYEPKGEKMHACYLYATSKSKAAFEQENKIYKTTKPEIIQVSKTASSTQSIIRPVVIASLVILVASIYAFLNYRSFNAHPSGLIVQKPNNGMAVPMEVLVEGRVSNADSVWIVVRYINGIRFWVQSPIRVENDGKWKGVIYLGEEHKGDIGLKSQIRAFVKPTKPLKYDEILYSWPEATLSSKAIEVIRAPANGLIIKQPLNGKTVPRQILAEGKVFNAKTVWIVVHGISNRQYWVQPPIMVKADGSWKGHIYVGSEAPEDIGKRIQIRAFVNPTEELKTGEALLSWPEAQLSSELVEVIRGLPNQ